MWKEAAVAWFEILYQQLCGGTEENHGNVFQYGGSQDRDLYTGSPEYETGLLNTPRRFWHFAHGRLVFLCSYYYVYKCTCHCRTFSSADVLHPVRCVDFCFAKYSAYWKNYFWCNGQRPPLLTRGVRRSCDGRKFFLLSYDSGVQVARITNEFVVAPMVASGGVLWWWVSQESGFGRRECVSTFNSLYTEIL